MIKNALVGLMSALSDDSGASADAAAAEYTSIDIEMQEEEAPAADDRDARDTWVRFRDGLQPIFNTERDYAVYLHDRACRFAKVGRDGPLKRSHFLQGTFELENYDGDMDDIVVDYVMSSYNPIARQLRGANITNPGAYPETSRMRLYVGGQDVVCYREEFVCIAVDFMMKLVGNDYALATVVEDDVISHEQEQEQTAAEAMPPVDQAIGEIITMPKTLQTKKGD